MKNHLLKKAVALCLFVSGISVFVLHQSGFFTGKNYGTYQGSHNGGALTASDSIYQHKRDSVKRRIQSSSKSIIPQGRLEEMVDKVLPKPEMKADVEKSSGSTRMPSSKVAIPSSFFEKPGTTADSEPFSAAADSVKWDTLKPFTNKKKQ